jgi:homospermidine synthase
MSRRDDPGEVTAVSTCGVNPGMLSWLMKRSMLDFPTI